jgi:lyso-ornithine lipid O-acyltransferase
MMASFRLLLISNIIFGFILTSLSVSLIPGVYRRRRLRVRLTSIFARQVCHVLGLKVEDLQGTRTEGLFVSNHLSFLDILVLASVRPSVFVTSNEMKEILFVRFIVELSGGAFVERRNRQSLRQDREKLEGLLSRRFSITLFPEGTTGDGRGVLPFKSGLFSAAVNSRVAVIPVTLNYFAGSAGRVLTELERARLFFTGDQGLGGHLYRIFTTSELKVQVHTHTKFSLKGNEDPREIAQRSRELVEGAFLAAV